MGLKNYIQFEPVRFATAISALGLAVAGLLALVSTAAIAAAVGGVWVAGVGVFNALFVRNAVTANPNVVQVAHDTIVALAPFAPVVTEAIVPVASSPLLDSTVSVVEPSGPNTP